MQKCLDTRNCRYRNCSSACSYHSEASYLMSQNSLNVSAFNYDTSVECKITNYYQRVLDSERYVGHIIEPKRNVINAFVARCIDMKYINNGHSTRVFTISAFDYLLCAKNQYNKDSDMLQYKYIWANNCHILILTGIDSMKWSEYDYVTWLQLIDSRTATSRLTFMFSSTSGTLMCSDSIRAALTRKLEEVQING